MNANKIWMMLLGASMTVGLGACSQDNPWENSSDAEGSINLNLQASGDVKEAIPAVAKNTRAQETLDELYVPQPEEFRLELTKIDGSWSKTYSTLSDFNGEEGFKVGAYTLKATYGSLEEEGFEKPCFAGETQFTVLEGRTVDAEIVASLANTMVSVDYTEAFKNYFLAYSANVHSNGGDFVTFEQTETRPAFVAPGDVAVGLTLTRPDGKTASVQPCSFAAVARHHYHITFDVNNGEVGAAQLEVIFDDTLTEENVFVDLTEELFTTSAPTVTAVGFESGITVEVLNGEASTTPLKFNVIAGGQLKEATLVVNSDNGYRPAFGSEINLIGADATYQQLIKSAGIDAKGFFRNPDVMAVLDITGFSKTLPKGNYTISLVAKDQLDRVCEPVSVNLTVKALEFTPAESTTIPFGSTEATIEVAFNGSNPADITFQAMDDNGNYVNAPVTKTVEITRTSRAVVTKSYAYTMTLPQTERKEIKVKVLYKGTEKGIVTVTVTDPVYEVAHDAYATKADFKFAASDASMSNLLAGMAKITLTGPKASKAKLVRHKSGKRRAAGDSDIKTLTGLVPNSQYTATISILSGGETKTVTFTTEAATNVPNGDFSQTTQTINRTGVQIGGKWHSTLLGSHTNSTSVTAFEPNGWASINQKTAYANASNINSWYFVRSTYVENGETTVRSVGYSHSGKTISETGSAGNSTYYNTNSPADADLTKVSGELFLGSYSFNGNESRTNGITFGSRPSSLEFQYRYAPIASEKGSATVRVLDGSGNVIASGSLDLTQATGMTKGTINLSGYPFKAKASKLEIAFRSTKKNTVRVNIPTGRALDEGGLGLKDNTVAANQSKAVATGSVLTIDNVKLNY